jgi:hypothetical protein
MAFIQLPERIPVRYLEKNRGVSIAFGLMALVGAVAFFVQLGRNETAAWASYVSNWLFFTSVAAGAVMFAAATSIVKARWNWSVRRVSLAFVAFLPVAFVLLIPMLLGLRENYFPWIEAMATDPIVQKKAAYLNVPFLITRNLVGPLLLFGLSFFYAYLALRPDMGLVDEGGLDAAQQSWRERLTTGWLGQEAEEVRSTQRMARVAPALGLAYAAVLSFVVYDFAMSLEPHWFSTLFGGWFFMGGFWGGIAATAFAAMWLRRQDPDLARAIGLQQRHDLGKLAFAFTVFWAYLSWSQYIVIWYGKLPWEQAWVIHRSGPEWGTFSATVVVLCFIIPFAGLLGRKPKLKPGLLQLFTGIILFGLWNERFMLVAPSILPEYDATNQFFHMLIGAGFLGLFMASVRWFLCTFPVLQLWQPMQSAEMLEAEVPMPRPETMAR